MTVKDFLVKSINKAVKYGWTIVERDYGQTYDKTCCPLTAYWLDQLGYFEDYIAFDEKSIDEDDIKHLATDDLGLDTIAFMEGFDGIGYRPCLSLPDYLLGRDMRSQYIERR